jgi:hypothetical protein
VFWPLNIWSLCVPCISPGFEGRYLETLKNVLTALFVVGAELSTGWLSTMVELMNWIALQFVA